MTGARRVRRWLQRAGGLVARAAALSVLIARAAALYACGAGGGPRDRKNARYGRFAADFVATATRYRGGLIKLGQLASLRIDVLPASVTEQLARLQDRVEPQSFREIERQLIRELGVGWRDHFGRFEEQPIASASLGQVHRAATRSGAELAVKILYPGIEASVGVDLAAARLALWCFDWLVVPDLMQVFRQVRESLLGEMDYLREGRAAERIGAHLAADPALADHLCAPVIYWEATRRRVLCMEYIGGDRINDREALEARGVEIDRVVMWAARAFLHMMLRDGDFHCDPHPGNLLVDSQGRVAIVDFGMNAQLREGTLAAMRDHVVAVVQRDRDAFARSLAALEMIDDDDIPVARELAELAFDPAYFNLTPAEVLQIDFVEYFGSLRSRLRRIRSFRIPDGLVMWGRALSLLYALVSELAPGLKPLDLLGPYALDFLQVGREAARRSKPGAGSGVEA